MLPPCRCCYVFIHSYGYDKYGYDKYGYSKSGYDKYGYGKDSYDSYGYDKHGYDKYGYNKEGYGKDSYHKDGYDRCALTVLLGLAFLALLCGTVEFTMTVLVANEYSIFYAYYAGDDGLADKPTSRPTSVTG
jgi:hypothetical protein